MARTWIAVAAFYLCTEAVGGSSATVSVDLSQMVAEIAQRLGADNIALPTSVNLDAVDAAEVCGLVLHEVADGCIAIHTTDALRKAVADALAAND